MPPLFPQAAMCLPCIGDDLLFPAGMQVPNTRAYSVAGVKDAAGNIWWIATHIDDVPH